MTLLDDSPVPTPHQINYCACDGENQDHHGPNNFLPKEWLAVLKNVDERKKGRGKGDQRKHIFAHTGMPKANSAILIFRFVK